MGRKEIRRGHQKESREEQEVEQAHRRHHGEARGDAEASHPDPAEQGAPGVSSGTQFHALVATDGSPDARAAVAAAVTFPWPRGAQVTGVVGRALVRAELPRASGLALESTLEQIAEETPLALSARWPRT